MYYDMSGFFSISYGLVNMTACSGREKMNKPANLHPEERRQ